MKKYLKQLYFILMVFCVTGVIKGLFSLVSFFQMSLYDIHIPGIGVMIEYDVRISYIVKTVIAIILAIACIVAIAMLHLDKIRGYKKAHLISIIVSSSTIFISLINMLLINNIGWIEKTSTDSSYSNGMRDYYEYAVYQIQESAIYSTFVPIIAISCAILVGAIYFFKKENAAIKKTEAEPNSTIATKESRKRLTKKQLKIAIISSGVGIIVIIFISLLACGVFSSSKNFEYIEENGQITITGYTGKSSKVKIPQKIKGKYVASIGEYAFSDESHVKEVILPNSVSVIEKGAFFNSNLEKIELSENITYIGDFAFYHSNIEEIDLGDELIYIGSSAFERTKLTEITLPSTLEEIGSHAFSYTEIEDIYIPTRIKAIGTYAFSDTSLTKVTFASNCYLTVLDTGVFKGCDKLSSITLPNGLTVINEDALADTGITSITLPGGLVEIGDNAFADTKFSTVTIPSSVSKISGNPFYRSSFDGSVLNEIIFEEPTGWKCNENSISEKPKIVYFSDSEKNVQIFDDGYSWYIYTREEN
ncbi:MAG: leucine-rich repeat domain-containing protein [Clostridia bacterium]|nr:leucine-rich repeat domain-containing protein [Clostridia bacterium]